VPPEVIAWLAAQGRKTKGMKVPGRKRGNSAHYAELARLRWEQDKAAQLQHNGPH
jgi:hypothetical protein